MTEHWTDDPQVREDPDLEQFLASVRSTALTPVDADTRHAHLSAMLASQPAPPPARRRLGTRVRRVLGLTATKVALTGTAALAATSGLAATGSLPDPVQDAVHDLGTRVGLDLPAATQSPPGLDNDTTAPGNTEHAPGLEGEPPPGQQVPAGDDAPGREDGPPPGQENDTSAPGDTEDAPGLQDRTPPGLAEDGATAEPPDTSDEQADTPDEPAERRDEAVRSDDPSSRGTAPALPPAVAER